MLDPQQELFIKLKLLISDLGYDVYDGEFPDGVAFPFVYLADSVTEDRQTKGVIYGQATQQIHIFHDDPEQRGTVSAMLYRIKRNIRELTTDTYKWNCNFMRQQISDDNSTGQKMLHGALEAEYLFFGR